MITAELIQQTESRFAERQAIRQERETKLRAGAVLEADDPDRVRKRVQHVARAIIETEGVGVPAQGAGVSALERIMGKNDLMSVRYLELGAQGGADRRTSARARPGRHRRRVRDRLPGLSPADDDEQSRADRRYVGGLQQGRVRLPGGSRRQAPAVHLPELRSDHVLHHRQGDWTSAWSPLKGDVRKIASYGWNGLSSAEGKSSSANTSRSSSTPAANASSSHSGKTRSWTFSTTISTTRPTRRRAPQGHRCSTTSGRLSHCTIPACRRKMPRVGSSRATARSIPRAWVKTRSTGFPMRAYASAGFSSTSRD